MIFLKKGLKSKNSKDDDDQDEAGFNSKKNS